jgi:FkbM family methyltransferase
VHGAVRHGSNRLRIDSGSWSRLSLADRLRVMLVVASGALLAPLRHRGTWRLCRMLWGGEESGEPIEVQLRLNADSLFAVNLRDPYWTRLLAPGVKHEAGIEQALRALADLPYVFVDAGANLGFWSILVSSEELGAHRAIAIEGASATYARLLRNQALNGDRFECVQGAVSDQSGGEIAFAVSAHHSSSGIAASGEIPDVRSTEMVPAMTLDEISERFGVSTGSVVLKLDVEGAEIAALRGASGLLELETLVLFEDHDRDPGSPVSAFLIDRGYRVFLPDGDGFASADLDEILSYKRRTSGYYNFLAARIGSLWEEAIRSRLG